MYLSRFKTVETALDIQCVQRPLEMAGEILCSRIPWDWFGTQRDILYPCGLNACTGQEIMTIQRGVPTFSMSRQSSGTRFAVVIAIRSRPDL